MFEMSWIAGPDPLPELPAEIVQHLGVNISPAITQLLHGMVVANEPMSLILLPEFWYLTCHLLGSGRPGDDEENGKTPKRYAAVCLGRTRSYPLPHAKLRPLPAFAATERRIGSEQ